MWRGQRNASGLFFVALWPMFCAALTSSRLHAQPPSTATNPQLAAIRPDANSDQVATLVPVAEGRLGPGSDAVTQYSGQSGLGEPSPYKLLRYDEDYRNLRDPARRADIWDPLKYISLSNDEDWYASFGGQVRPRADYQNNFNFGTIPGGNSYTLQRYLFHGDFHFGPNVRFFGQVMSGLESNRIGGPRPEVDRDVFDGHQAFVDLVQHFEAGSSLTWRVGRQEMAYGAGRLVDVREGVNLRRSFDAGRLLLRVDDWSVDGFISKPVINQPSVFDDATSSKLALWGIYGVRPLTVLPDGHVDLYYLGYENKHAIYDQASGYELRNSLGMRMWGRPTPWDYDIEAIGQFGQFGDGRIAAWGLATTTGYSFPDTYLRPRVGLVADMASGDRNPKSSNLQTFNPMFPTGAYLNMSNPIGPANFIQVHPCVEFFFGAKVIAKADWAFVWRQSLHDGIYGPFVGPPIRSGQLSNARFVGSSPSFTLTWKATRHVTVLASYVHFFAGTFLKETPPGKDTDYVTAWVDYTF